MKSSSKNYINLRKVGGFYQCFDEDAYLLFYLFGYKVNNDRAGFPISSLNKIINTLGGLAGIACLLMMSVAFVKMLTGDEQDRNIYIRRINSYKKDT